MDGRQRSTAIAIAFGGLRAESGSYRHCGRFFLNVSERDETKRIQYIKTKELEKRGLLTEASCISEGLFPLAPDNPEETVLEQWMRYLPAILDPQYYPNNQPPEPKELAYRSTIIRNAFDGIINTKLAVYIVPDHYDLGKICDIFETLNTTGTKVSTVDLIHSWLYSESSSSANLPNINLRDWITTFGQLDGAVGWSIPDDRPELLAQIVTACHVALDNKFPPRKVGNRTKPAEIASVKSGDLLATPAEHWNTIIENEGFLATILGDFQNVVAEGYFPFKRCPYPVSAAIYVGLRWHFQFDNIQGSGNWSISDLDALYRAFFWRNALGQRYDQGFLTQLGVDLKNLKSILGLRNQFKAFSDWAAYAEDKIEQDMKTRLLPSEEELYEMLLDGKPTGAMQRALQLQLYAHAKTDILNPSKSISYPDVQDTELHHIYPKAWCRDNLSAEKNKLTMSDGVPRDSVNSTANMLVLTRSSNNYWSSRNPKLLIEQEKLQYSRCTSELNRQFIDEEDFHKLEADSNPIDFWETRAKKIAKSLVAHYHVHV